MSTMEKDLCDIREHPRETKDGNGAAHATLIMANAPVLPLAIC